MMQIIVSLAIATTLFIYLIYKNKYNYWTRKNLNGPKPFPIFGNYTSVFLGFKSEPELLQEIYEEYPDDLVGIYKGLQPVLIVKNPIMVKQILYKDFDKFNARCVEQIMSIFSHSIYIMNGEENWKNVRKIFAPGFLSDRIEKMFPLIQHSIKKYLKYLEIMTCNTTYFETRCLQNKYTLNAFSKLIFNTEHDVFAFNKFESSITAFINSKLQMSLIHIAEFVCPSIATSKATYICNSLNKYHYILRDYLKFLMQEITSKGVKRNNFLEFLISLRETGKTRKDKTLPVDIDDDFIIQQSLTFFLTAFESTSSTLAFIVYELAHNEAIQDKCVKELSEIFDKCNENITIESLNQMKYLQMVIDETMRKHPIQIIDRKCMAKYTFSDRDLMVDKDVFVYIPVHSLHNDPKYFPNPELFDPERFSAKNKEKIPQCVYMPFGDGPRMCIGHRLAKIVMLLGISAFLRRYKVLPTTNIKTKLQYDPKRTRIIAPLGGLWVKIEKRI